MDIIVVCEKKKIMNDFHNIKFESTDFESSKTKVHFIAGNAETEALYDIISDLDNNKEKNDNNSKLQ